MKIGNEIRKRRTELKMTQDDLAQKINVTRSAISNWEIGRNYPDIQTLVALSDTLDISLDQLLRSDSKMIKAISLEPQKKKKLILIISLLALLLLFTGGATAAIWGQQTVTLSPKDLNIEKIEKIPVPAQIVDGVQIKKDYKYVVLATLNSTFITWDTVRDSANNYRQNGKVAVSFQGRRSLHFLNNRKENSQTIRLEIPSFAAQTASDNQRYSSYNIGKKIVLVGDSHQTKLLLSSNKNK